MTSAHRIQARSVETPVVQRARDQSAVTPRRRECGKVPRTADPAAREQLHVGIGLSNLAAQLEVDAPPGADASEVDHDDGPDARLHRSRHEGERGVPVLRAWADHRPTRPKVEREYDAPVTVGSHGSGQRVEGSQCLEARDYPIRSSRQHGSRVFGRRYASVGQQTDPDAGDVAQKRDLLSSASNRVQVSDVALLAPERRPEGARQSNRIARLFGENGAHRRILVANTALRPHRASRHQVQHRNHAHRGAVEPSA